MPNPTLYDNFNQVRQYIDQNQVDLSSYVSKSELEGMSYATTSYVADYVAEHGGGGSTVIDENIIPKENNTYTLGSESYLYAATYTGSLYLHPNNGWINVSNWQTKFRIDNSDKYYLTSNRFYPNVNGACHLGLRTNKWGDTYTSNIYADNAYSTYIVGPQGHINLNGDTQAPFILSYDVSGTTTKLMQLAYRYAGDNYKGWKFAPLVNEDINLGSYNSHGVTQWGSTYTKNLYLDGTPIQSIINSLFSYDTATGTLTITTL